MSISKAWMCIQAIDAKVDFERAPTDGQFCTKEPHLAGLPIGNAFCCVVLHIDGRTIPLRRSSNDMF